MAQPRQFTKDPDAVLDWRFDWSLWLEDGETITTAEVLTEELGVDSTSHDDDSVTAFLSGGEAGDNAEVTCRVTTDQGRTDDRTIRIRVRER